MTFNRFLNRPVDAAVPWPTTRIAIRYGEWEIIASPSSQETDTYLHINLSQRGLDEARGASVLSQLLSICTWLEDQYAVLLDGWAGNPVPVQGRRRTHNLVTFPSPNWPNNWTSVPTPQQRIALAIYREAVNMEHFHSQPYSLLGYYKVLEFIYPKGIDRALAIELHFREILKKKPIENHYLKALGLESQPTAVSLRSIVVDQGRHAVAHAKGEPIVNPDDLSHQRKMSVAIQLLRPLVRRAMHAELMLSNDRWDQFAAASPS